MEKREVVDLTDPAMLHLVSPPPAVGNKRAAEVKTTTPLDSRVAPAVNQKRAKVAKKNLPHALIWICHCGPGRNGKWTQKNLKIIGVYDSKEAAEARKRAFIKEGVDEEGWEECGHGDILVGGTWEDEIDLVVRPVGDLDD